MGHSKLERWTKNGIEENYLQRVTSENLIMLLLFKVDMHNGNLNTPN